MLLETLEKIAAERHCTPAQVALAWLLHRSQTIVPIPGTKRPRYLEENVGSVDVLLSLEDLACLDRDFALGAVSAERSPADLMKRMGLE